MRWVDERIFGWSGRDRKSVPRSGATSPAADSGAETEGTDDDADYDQVINILHRHSTVGLEVPGSPVKRSVNSRGQSYADLRTLKRTTSNQGLGMSTSPLAQSQELPTEETPLLFTGLKKRSGSGADEAEE